MICPVCKKTIPEDTLRCPHCNARIGLVCKNCHTVNSIFETKCKKCGNEILKICPSCNAVNFPNVEKCRKCGTLFTVELPSEPLQTSNESTVKQVSTPQEEELQQTKSPVINTEEENDSSNDFTINSETDDEIEVQYDEEPEIQENIISEPLIKKEEIKTEPPEVDEGVPNELPEVSGLEYSTEYVSQEQAKSNLVKNILSSDKKIFSLSGWKGIGKTIVLKSVMYDLSKNNIAWLYGKCTPFSQLTSGGLIQDFMLNVFNLANFCINTPQFQKDAFKFFKNEFPEMSQEEIFDLINFLYPHVEGTFEELLSNKTKMFKFLEKIFDKIILNVNCVIVIDNFNLIDAFSYEFLLKYIKKENVWQKLKLIAIYNEPKPVKGYFYFPDKHADLVYQDIAISPFEYEQMVAFLESKKQTRTNYPEFTKDEKHQIYKLSKGNPAFFEQIFALKADCSKSGQPFELSRHISGIVNQRLTLLSYLNPKAHDVLVCAATLGDKINLNIMQEVFQLSDEDFKNIITYLVENDFIIPMSDIYYEFKSITLWDCVLEKSKLEEDFIKINELIFEFLTNFTLNSIAILGIIAQNLKQPQLALDIWTRITRFTSYIGDISLYAISQKQCLALINELDDNETLKIRFNISERLGKLLTETNPKDAMEFLPDAINNAKNTNNIPKEIELLSYLATCCRKTGNYYGEVECVDTVLEKATENTPLEIALLKCSKLKALLCIGNSGQIINMIDNEILPVFDEFFNTKPDNTQENVAFIFESWVKTYLILAQALTLQGNNRSFEVLTILFEIIENNKIQDELFICKCKLTLALANTMKGSFTDSEKILAETLKLYQTNVMDNETIIQWNFVDIINKFSNKKYDGIQEDLFQVVTFANNNGDNFTKNILKVLLGKYFKDKDEPKKAMDIYNDQIVYFAKEKMALGALMTWFMIADVSLILEGPESTIEIATQSLDVAQNPKINNYYFTILLKIVLAKAFIIKSDFDSAKMHIETAIKIAKNFEMKDLLSRLYLMYGKYFQEIGLVKSERQQQYMVAAAKMYMASLALVKETRNAYVYRNIQKAQRVLVSFCQMNNIELKG